MSYCIGIPHDKVPIKEREFLIDQRTERKMFNGEIDNKETQVLQKRMERQKKNKKD